MKKIQAETTLRAQLTPPKNKDGITSSIEQERFLPLVDKADFALKFTALSCALDMRPIGELKFKHEGIIRALEDKIPKWTIDYKSYVRGAKITSEIATKTLFNGVINDFVRLKREKISKKALLGIETPRELIELLNRKPNVFEYAKRRRYEQIHGQPNCEAYGRKLRERINLMAHREPLSATEGKSPISAFAKAELDLRHEEQINKLDKLIKHGYRLCWLSSHADCSPRCAPWQGKLVDIVHESPLPSHRMNYKKDGYTVYSLKSIMSETDKYGYHNTIINGFNCRHHLIPYAKGSKPPRHVSEEERKREYETSQTLRGYERKIRELKRKAMLYNGVDKKLVKEFAKEAEALTKEYISLAKANGFTWHRYRLEV